jgi:hypothetical protein
MVEFTSLSAATTHELPTHVAVMDPCHVVAPDEDSLSDGGAFIPTSTALVRRFGVPLSRPGTLHAAIDLLTDKQTARLRAAFGWDGNAQVQATGRNHQRLPTARRLPGRRM